MISKNDVKFIRSLRLKKHRYRQGCFLVEGEKGINELLKSKIPVRMLILRQGIALEGEHEFISVDDSMLNQLTALETNSYGIAVAEMMDPPPFDFGKNILILDDIRDPGNMGTIIRTADWFGIRQIVCSMEAVDFYNPKVIQATMGSFTRIVPRYENLNAFLEQVSGDIYGADLNGENLYTSKTRQPFVLVMGSESHGLSIDLNKRINRRLTIPRIGEAESLNVSVATGILLNHLIRA